ncbi:MAG: DUF202 domain-containing protein [Desulfobacterales bacterium]
MSPNDDNKSLTNELAKERNREAVDRTLMAWIRTAISLIGFGFAIAQSYQFLESDYVQKTGRVLDSLHTPFIFGISFMVLGILGMIAGVIQYNRILDRIQSDRFIYIRPWALPKIMAILLVIIGVFGILAIIF